MTELQRQIANLVRAAHPGWFRAQRAGHRVTLASLYRAGVLERRAWRGVAGEADAAYEYRLAPAVRAELGLAIE